MRGSGDIDRCLRWGGGVIESARGVEYGDEAGDAAGEDSEGLVTRLGTGMPIVVLTDRSSSEVAISTSLSSDDRNDGSSIPFDGPGGGEA